jgi:hypothetical protein
MPMLADLGITLSNLFKYNLQVLPDTLLAATLIFALLFQSAPLATLGVGLILNAALHPLFAGFLSRNISGLAAPADGDGRCSGRFPGLSFTGAAAFSGSNIDTNAWPSYYTTFIGFFLTYIMSLKVIYKDELEASPNRNTSTTTGIVIAAFLLLLVVAFRYSTGCDDPVGLGVGILFGAVLGGVYVMIMSRLSDRTLTNMLALPLFKDVAVDGKPIYVCA